VLTQPVAAIPNQRVGQHPFDLGNAVMVLIGGVQVGYVPADDCPLVRAVMAHYPGRPFTIRALITAGGWNGRWDMSVGSMTPTNDRQEVLHFTEPYYFTPAVVVANEANTSISDLSTDLDGTRIGVCSGCSYEQFLDKSLEIDGFDFDFAIDDAEVSGYDTDTTALQDLALGDGTRLDAVITSATTAQGYVDSGRPVKTVGEPVFYEPLAAAFDKNAELDPTSLVEAVDGIVKEMHSDGTLGAASKEWYNGLDLSVQQ